MYCSHPIKGTNAPDLRTPNARIRTSPDTQINLLQWLKVYPMCLWEETRRPQDRINDIRRLNVRGRAPWQRLATKPWTHVKGVRTGGGEATVLL
ncbi:hypothetical protein ElyMa_001596100 [Elysia marginata]|uniref:Uncharacterized protein n=1 Tax=Elysia marginata TaxID=1093978 RepID=A0AAV4JFE3_9GAST|nr:hypothetical protein ElyMa_001596100 [Elysia marginata]